MGTAKLFSVHFLLFICHFYSACWRFQFFLRELAAESTASSIFNFYSGLTHDLLFSCRFHAITIFARCHVEA